MFHFVIWELFECFVANEDISTNEDYNLKLYQMTNEIKFIILK